MTTKQLTFDDDPCARKHGGNEQSEEAWRTARISLCDSRRRVLHSVKCAGFTGATSKEIARDLNVPLNTISGRFSELKRMHMIRRRTDTRGKTITRDGCAVWEVTR